MLKLPSVDGYDDESMADELGVDASAQPEIPPQPDASLDDIAPPEATAKPDAMDVEIMRQLERQPSSGAPPPMPVAAAPGTDDMRADKDAIAEGRQRDDNARLMRGIELGGKQLIAGVLHQDKVAEVVSPESTNYEGQAKADAERGEAKRYQRGQGEIAAAHQRYMTERQAKLDGLTEQQKKAAAEAKTKQDEWSRTHGDASAAEIARHNREQELIGKDKNAATRDAARIASGKAGDAEANASFTFDGTDLVAPKGISKEEAKEVKDKAELYNGAFEALDSIKEAIQGYVSNPTPDTFNDINSRGRIAAASLTAAIGGGAMAEGEAKAAISAMGADPTSFLAGKALFDTHVLGGDPAKASTQMLSKLGAARNTLRRSGLARFKTHNYTANAAAPKPTVWKNPKTGEEIEVH